MVDVQRRREPYILQLVQRTDLPAGTLGYSVWENVLPGPSRYEVVGKAERQVTQSSGILPTDVNRSY
jgi:hypothetical protein